MLASIMAASSGVSQTGWLDRISSLGAIEAAFYASQTGKTSRSLFKGISFYHVPRDLVQRGTVAEPDLSCRLCGRVMELLRPNCDKQGTTECRKRQGGKALQIT
jgi:hypothetical protein